MNDQGDQREPRLESDRLPGSPVGLTSIGGKGAYVVLFSQIGFTLLVANLGGALLGHWVDGLLGSGPLLLVVGFIVGFAVGAVGAAQLVMRALRRFEVLDAEERAARLARRLAESERWDAQRRGTEPRGEGAREER